MKVVFVTGASRGIGRAIASRYASDSDVQLVLQASNLHNLGEVNEIVSGLSRKSPLLLGYDLKNVDEISEAFKSVRQHYGKLDIMINNAGIMVPAPLGMISKQLIDDAYEVNVRAPILHLQYSSKIMKRNGGG